MNIHGFIAESDDGFKVRLTGNSVNGRLCLEQGERGENCVVFEPKFVEQMYAELVRRDAIQVKTKIVTGFEGSNGHCQREDYALTDANVQLLVDKVLERLGATAESVINIQTTSSPNEDEFGRKLPDDWGVRVFCRVLDV